MMKNMLCDANPVLVLRDGRPVACEHCAPCDVYFEAGFSDDDVIWEMCDVCEISHTAVIREYWDEKIEWMNNGDITPYGQLVARIEGNHYVIGRGKKGDKLLGTGGQRVIIKFIDGPHKGFTVVTNDLWQQGEIEMEKELLLDNAKFIRAEK